MKIMLDTNTSIYILKRKPIEVFERFNKHVPGDIGVSTVTVAELYFGVEKSQRPLQNRQAFEQFLLPLVIVPFDYNASITYGGIRAALEKQGTPIGSLDLFIAAQAITLDVELITNNVREFSRVPGLRLDNWVVLPQQP